MLATAASRPSAPSDLAWRVVGLLSLYRLLVPVVLAALQWLGSAQWTAAATEPALYTSACIGYFTAAVLLVVARRLHWSSLRIIALVNSSVDAVCVAIILYASGGVGSGLGILLVLPVLAMAMLANHLDALLIASVAALAVLVQQIFVGLADAAPATDYTTAGFIGLVLFGMALLAWPIANRLRESEALVRRQEVDLANMAQLSQYIVQHLRESLLVVDPRDRIRLINESAAQMLGDTSAYPDALLGEASPRLLYLLETWRQGTHLSGTLPSADQTFVGADGARVIRAHFAPLGTDTPAPVLIFLEDTSLLAEKIQQTKLAALGRLSASIAHEIRNPVGAMSHAAQLLAESPVMGLEERRLTDIIRNNAERVSGIINNVLRLSKREDTHLERLDLDAWIREFLEEFFETMQYDPARVRTLMSSGDVEVRADSSQLRQIVWNLCENAFKHGGGQGRDKDNPSFEIEVRAGRLTPSARPFLEIADRGPGVPPEHVERIFEPFFSGRRGGTGLGLFLARELAQTNGATLLYEPRTGGGSIFRLVFADPRRWEMNTK